MAESGLDADKIAALENWATGLQGDPRPEVAASGRAILMLIDEIERLHVIVWGRALYPQETADAAETETAKPELAPTLRGRLRRRLRRPAEDLPTGEPEPGVIHSESTAP